uniref:Polyamine aminopropyltransferase n=1 Tax=uncultured marine group II/III euryarchaeote KM3_149_F06 TaxID=1457885 RepID=A0A075GIW5_9EURY|nr:spermine/spermidine synthase (SRM, speE) [uncultured marine group II/III euryarchaeote KM3_149_F06]
MFNSNKKKRILLAFAFFSGFAALIYEIIWLREIHLIFGVSSYSLATVFSTFLLGLVLGSYFGGKYIESRSSLKSVAKSYAFVEFGIAFFALLVPLMIFSVTPILTFFHNLNLELFSFNLVKFVLSAFILIIPATFIGTTFPIIVRLYAEKRSEIKEGVSMLYFANTFGGVLGVLSAGFFLIRFFGMNFSLGFAVFLNLGISFFALRMSKRYSNLPLEKETNEIKEKFSGKINLLLVLFFVSGLTALAYEVIWGRLLVLYFFGTVYATSVLLATFLLGIAGGSWIYSKYFRRASLVNFAYLELAVSFFAMLGLLVYFFFPENLVEGFATSLSVLFLLSAVMVLIPGICFGIIFPLVSDYVLHRRKSIGFTMGKLYSINTLGAIFGAFVAGFFLIPFIGIKISFIFLSLLGVFIALIILFISNHSSLFSYVFVGFTVLFIFTTAFVIPSQFFGSTFKSDVNISYYEEGLSATVSVVQNFDDGEEFSRIYVDGQEVAASTPIMSLDSKILAHLPLLLHKNPQNALTVGFGSGGTSYSMLTYDLEEVDVVEIEENVIKAQEFFKELSYDVLKNPKLNIITDDARSYISLTDKKYDVISTDCTNLRYGSNSNLYTEEYFAILKSRLNSEGIVSVWVPVLGVREEEQKILMNTFRQVFPHMSVWYMYNKLSHYFVYIGTESELDIDFSKFEKKFDKLEIKEDLEKVGITKYNLLNGLFLDEVAVNEYVSESKIHTDNNPVLEFPKLTPIEKSDYGKNMLSVYGRKVDPLPYISGFVDEFQEEKFLENFKYEQEKVARNLILGHSAMFKEDYNNAAIYYSQAIENSDYLEKVDV